MDPYRKARKLAGLGLFAAVAAMVLFDASSRDFAVDPLVLIPMLVSGLACLDVDGPLSSLLAARGGNAMPYNRGDSGRRGDMAK